jgi:hypothetical protein
VTERSNKEGSPVQCGIKLSDLSDLKIPFLVPWVQFWPSIVYYGIQSWAKPEYTEHGRWHQTALGLNQIPPLTAVWPWVCYFSKSVCCLYLQK